MGVRVDFGRPVRRLSPGERCQFLDKRIVSERIGNDVEQTPPKISIAFNKEASFVTFDNKASFVAHSKYPSWVYSSSALCHLYLIIVDTGEKREYSKSCIGS